MPGTQATGLMLRLEQGIADEMIELVLEIESNVREATPIDTGNAAAHWTDSLGAPATEQVDSVLAAIARAETGRAEILGYELGMGDLFVSNPTNYIEHLNRGTSPQAEPEFIERAAEQAKETVQARHNAERTEV